MPLLNKRKLILIAICIILGLLVAFQETRYFQSKKIEYAQVVTLSADVETNTILTKGQLEYKEYPKNIVNGEFAQNIDQAVGMYIIHDKKEGTPLFVSDISNKKTVTLPEGMVRVTFLTNLQDALAGAITPGSHVDIGFVSKDGAESRLLFTSVQIAKITDKSGNELNNGETEKKTNAYANKEKIPATVTVILQPDESVLLKQHELLGKIYLMGH